MGIQSNNMSVRFIITVILPVMPGCNVMYSLLQEAVSRLQNNEDFFTSTTSLVYGTR